MQEGVTEALLVGVTEALLEGVTEALLEGTGLLDRKGTAREEPTVVEMRAAMVNFIVVVELKKSKMVV